MFILLLRLSLGVKLYKFSSHMSSISSLASARAIKAQHVLRTKKGWRFALLPSAPIHVTLLPSTSTNGVGVAWKQYTIIQTVYLRVSGDRVHSRMAWWSHVVLALQLPRPLPPLNRREVHHQQPCVPRLFSASQRCTW